MNREGGNFFFVVVVGNVKRGDRSSNKERIGKDMKDMKGRERIPNEGDVDTKIAVSRGAFHADEDSKGHTGPGWVLGIAIKASLEGRKRIMRIGDRG
jgi:hypothetical protein